MMLLNFVSKKNRSLFLLLFLFALIVRTIYFFEFKENPYFNYVHPAHDSIIVHNGAMEICNGNVLLDREGSRYPFYTYFVSAIYLLMGEKIYGVWIAQFILGALAAALLFLTGSRLFNRRVGVIVSLFYALYGPNLFYEGVMLRAALTEFLAVLSFYFLLRLTREISYGNLVLSGIALSMMIQCRPNTVMVLPLVMIYLYFKILKEEVLKRKLMYFFTFMLALIAIGTPLLVRGIYVEKGFQFYDPGGPSVFLMGNLVDYDGSGWHGGSPRFHSLQKAYHEKVYHDYRWVLNKVFKEMIDYPLGFVGLYVRKAYHFFNNYEIPSNNNFYLHQRFSNLLKNPLSNFSLVISLAFLGLVMTFKDYRKIILLYVFLLAMTGSVLLFYNVSRFRMPAVPFYLLFSSVGVYALYQLVLDRKFVKIFFAAFLVVGLLFCLKVPDIQKIRRNDYGMLCSIYDERAIEHINKGFYQEALKGYKTFMKICPSYKTTKIYNNVGNLYCEMGLYDEALREFRNALQLKSDCMEAHVNLGSMYIEKGLYDEAVEHLKEAERLDPGRAEVYINLGVVYSGRGDFDKAVEVLKKAVSLNHDFWQLHYNLAIAYENKKLYRESIESYKKVLELQPDNLNAHIFSANLYLKVKEWDKARHHFAETLRLAPDQPRAEEIRKMIAKLSMIHN